MIDVIEDVKNEFKVKLTDKLEREIIAFLNSDGGNIYLGVDDKGYIVGINGNIDEIQRTIKDRLNTNISPSILGFYEIKILKFENKKYLKIIVKKGIEMPYYLTGMGMTPESCFIRVGSAIQEMPREQIDYEFNRRHKNSLICIESPKQKLTFRQLKIFYEEKGFKINDNFYNQLNLYTEDKKFNLLAYILSDNNNISIRYGKYNKENDLDLIEFEEYGYCSIIKATYAILDKIYVENKTYTKITYPDRKQIKLFDYDAVREAVINAMCHNDWAREDGPKFEIFGDRIVISSHGGLQNGISKEDFLKGYSHPKSNELMKIFKDLELVEHMGTGIKRMLESYNEDIFNFYPNFITVTFKFKENKFENVKVIDGKIVENSNIVDLTETQKMIIELITGNPSITQIELAKKLSVAERTIRRNLKELIDKNMLERVGARKNGIWKIIE